MSRGPASSPRFASSGIAAWRSDDGRLVLEPRAGEREAIHPQDVVYEARERLLSHRPADAGVSFAGRRHGRSPPTRLL